MKPVARTTARVVAFSIFLIALSARAMDLSQPVMLVASSELDGTAFEQTVVFAAPLPDGSHIGFIVNRPTTVKLEMIFPDEAPTRNVKEPVYLGGPVMPQGVFALSRNAADVSEAAIALMPGIVAILDAPAVDRMIEAAPNAARYFVGMMVWQADELQQQIDNRLWEVQPADVDSVLPAKAPGLWNSLRSPMAGGVDRLRAG